MKKPFSRNQQIISITLSAVLAVTASIWMIVAKPKNVSVVSTVPVTTQVKPTEKTNATVISVTHTKTQITKKVVVEPTAPAQNIISFTLTAGTFSTSLNPVKGTTLYDAFVQAHGAGKIEFVVKEYPGLGFYVTDIGSLHEVSGKHLIYYVNGKEATVGVSLYTPKQGDIISWKLE